MIGQQLKVRIESTLFDVANMPHFVGLGLTDELLGYIFLPISSFGSYKLWDDIGQNYLQYAEKLEEYDGLGPSMLSNLSIK